MVDTDQIRIGCKLFNVDNLFKCLQALLKKDMSSFDLDEITAIPSLGKRKAFSLKNGDILYDNHILENRYALKILEQLELYKGDKKYKVKRG